MKLFVFVLGIFLLSAQVCAIVVSEIEINSQDGSEWIEIYNDEGENLDLSGWGVYDGLVSEKERYVFPQGSEMKEEEYLIVELGSRILNNGGDYIILKDEEGKRVYETEELSESESSEDTWQYCLGEWNFGEETKGEENFCEEKIEENGSPLNEGEGEEIVYEETSKDDVLKPATLNEINLESKDIKREENLDEPKGDYYFYGILGFLTILIFLFLVNKRKYTKNEFG